MTPLGKLVAGQKAASRQASYSHCTALADEERMPKKPFVEPYSLHIGVEVDRHPGISVI